MFESRFVGTKLNKSSLLHRSTSSF